MGFSESDSSKCRRHPNPKQLPGVCSSCLRDRLSKLSTSPDSFTNSKKKNNSSDSSSPSFSSASSSSTAATRSRGHRRNGSDATYVSVGMVLNNGLKKSRSVSCAPLSSRSCREKMGDGKSNSNIDNMISSTRKKIKNINISSSEFKDEEKEGGDNCKMMKKKLGGGFLKKLIHTTSKKTKGALMHSKTMKERSSHSNTNAVVQT